MEEILASIRRIISEDDGAEPTAPTLPPVPPEPPQAARAGVELPDLPPLPDEPASGVALGLPDDESDELELTDKVESHGDLDVYAPSPAEAEPPVEPAPAMGHLVSAPAAAAAAAAFGRLSGNMAMPAAGRTLEDVVRELLRPLLQQYLDENLPGIVQRTVDAEVARIARGG
jgi:cell pole-organizing protein PopZ